MKNGATFVFTPNLENEFLVLKMGVRGCLFEKK
jgi:hypothetical protein